LENLQDTKYLDIIHLVKNHEAPKENNIFGLMVISIVNSSEIHEAKFKKKDAFHFRFTIQENYQVFARIVQKISWLASLEECFG